MNIDGENNQLPTWRLWGEERCEGAIYAVYLKKVRYHRPSKSISDSEDEISHLEWETVRVRLIKAGTLEKLVESLASDSGELESTYVNIFLATYRTFSSANQVMTLITQRYQDLTRLASQSSAASVLPEAVAQEHLKTLRSSLHLWLDAFPEDFCDPPNYTLLNQLLAFCDQHAKDSQLHFEVKHRLLKNAELKDKAPNVQRNLAANADPSNPNGLQNGCHGLENETATHAVFLDLSEKRIAEQLTRLDAELFRRVIPHQCLGAVWSRRDRDKFRLIKGTPGSSSASRSSGSSEASSVLATVEQFNAVSYRVISTILMGSDQIRSQLRAKVIAKWIDVAQELRVLKNFSSLKAIISALQSNPIYRLKHVWTTVAKDKVELYEELARIFSEENNQSAQRELLMKEGTAKFAQTVGENDRQMQKVLQKQASHSNIISHGTIPYLGTFLTDLTMIDTAIADTVTDGLINFDKRRKEFEVLAQIKLLQCAASSYHIETDIRFEQWFDSLPVLDDREAYELSCTIEPSNTPSSSSGATSARNSEKFRRKPGCGHKKNDSIASTSSSSSSQFLSELDNGTTLSLGDTTSLEQKIFQAHLSSSSSSSSLPSLDVSVSSGTNSQNATPSKAGSLPRGVTPPHSVSPMRTPDFYVIRVSIASPSKETEGINLYKSIMVSNHERTPQVIRNAMVKHGLEGNPDDYSLSQLLPKGVEMVLPSNANVYYAVNTSCDLNFILRLKSEMTPPNSVVATPTRPRMRDCKDSAGKDTLKARKKILSLGT